MQVSVSRRIPGPPAQVSVPINNKPAWPTTVAVTTRAAYRERWYCRRPFKQDWTPPHALSLPTAPQTRAPRGRAGLSGYKTITADIFRANKQRPGVKACKLSRTCRNEKRSKRNGAPIEKNLRDENLRDVVTYVALCRFKVSFRKP